VIDFLSRILVSLKIFAILKDLKLYSDYLTIIKKESLSSPQWGKYKLRKDWFGRIYTVVNLPPEVTQSRDFPEEARPAFVFEEIRPVNEYLTKLNLHELIAPLLQPIKETNGDSFLVVYYFVFRELSWIWIIRFAVEVYLLVLAIKNWDFLLSYLHINGLG
jgi:hypothetical protein